MKYVQSNYTWWFFIEEKTFCFLLPLRHFKQSASKIVPAQTGMCVMALAPTKNMKQIQEAENSML